MALVTQTLFAIEDTVWLTMDVENTTNVLMALHGRNNTPKPCRVTISQMNGQRQTIANLPANMTQDVTVTLAPASRITLTPYKDLWDALNCLAQYPFP